MKSIIFRIFNSTAGKMIRLIQRTLIPRNSIQGVFHLINQQALQDSAQYAANNFSNAMQFDKRTELWSYCLSRISRLQTGGSLLSSESGKESQSTFLQKIAPEPRFLGLTLLKA
jgi:hypothetical protein